jgi:hypothetical protein
LDSRHSRNAVGLAPLVLPNTRSILTIKDLFAELVPLDEEEIP